MVQGTSDCPHAVSTSNTQVVSINPDSHIRTYRFSPSLLRDPLGYDLKSDFLAPPVSWLTILIFRRKPAWTDRILHLHNQSTAPIHQHSYTGHFGIAMSDHRPLSADFSVLVDVWDKSSFEATAKRLYREVDGMENSSGKAPLKFDQSSVDLGKIGYLHHRPVTLTLRNLGKVSECGGKGHVLKWKSSTRFRVLSGLCRLRRELPLPRSGYRSSRPLYVLIRTHSENSSSI